LLGVQEGCTTTDDVSRCIVGGCQHELKDVKLDSSEPH
jgi:hypothetical protein